MARACARSVSSLQALDSMPTAMSGGVFGSRCVGREISSRWWPERVTREHLAPRNRKNCPISRAMNGEIQHRAPRAMIFLRRMA